jgi:hypothetical protein
MKKKTKRDKNKRESKCYLLSIERGIPSVIMVETWKILSTSSFLSIKGVLSRELLHHDKLIFVSSIA